MAEVIDVSADPIENPPKSPIPVPASSAARQFDIFQILGAASAIGAGTAMPLMSLIYGNLANDYNDYQNKDSAALKKIISSQVLYLVYIFIGMWALTFAYGILLSISAMNYSRRLRAAYVKSVIRQDTGLVSQGKVAENLATCINVIEDALSEKLGVVMQAISTVVVSLIIAFVHSWQLTLVLFSTIVVLFVSNFGTAALDTGVEQQAQKIDEEAATVAEEGLDGIRMIMACVAESKLGEKYRAILDQARIKRVRKSPILAVQFSISYFCLLSSYALAFWYGTILLDQGRIGSGGTIVIVILSINQGTNGMRKILPIYGLLSKARAASTTLSKVINSTPTIDSLDPNGVVLGPLRGMIRIENVSFSYPARPTVKVLDNLSIDFKVGEITALVGTSGSGKSTIVGLLERWYDPSSGAVIIDDYDVTKLNLRCLRSNIGLVQQDVTLFDNSIFYNVASGLYGTPSENLTEQEKRAMVVQSCTEVGAHSFIQELPHGYDTKVGDKGKRLSGGQQQRLSIARAIIASPKILIFDEVTSGLDAESERIVETAIKRVSRGRTTIIIAHKLSLIQQADQIVLLKNGQVVEKGTHQSLLAMNGKYARFYEAQELDIDITPNEVDLLALESTEIHEMKHVPSVAEKIQDKHTTPPRDTPETSMETPSELSLFGCCYTIFVEHRFLRLLFIALIPTSVIASAVYPLQGVLFGNSVGEFSHTNEIKKYEDFWALMWFIVALATSTMFFFVGILSSNLGTAAKFYYQIEYFGSMLRQKPFFFDHEEQHAGTLVASLSLHTNEVQSLLTVIGSLLVSISCIASCSILSLVIAWRLALVGLFGSVPVIVLAGYLRVRSAAAKSKSLSGPLLDSAQYASEVIGAVRTVAALTMEQEVFQQLDWKMRQSLPIFYKNLFTTMPLFAFSESGSLIGMALIFWYGGNLLADGELKSTTLWIAFLSVYTGGQVAAEFFTSSSSIFRAKQSINEIFSLRPKIQTAAEEVAQKSTDEEQVSANSIAFHKVNFSYPNAPNHQVLQDINFSVSSGCNLAIVGPSGSGKSTIIALLEKFYHADSGSILIGGTPLNSVDTNTHRRMTSLVSQNTILFHGTVRENILLGTSSETTDEQLESAAKDANIHEFISSLPEGYNTQCGNKGIAFSGGQRQRLALCRALVRKPKILLLDEATSALDSLSEIEVLDALSHVAKDTTTVTVAHRLATIRNADCILVLVKGKIVERGSHTELMDMKGTYWAMNRSQALDKEL